MHASSFDTNSGSWNHQEFDTGLSVGPEAALDFLCKDNTSHYDDDGCPPMGPLRYKFDGDCFVLVAAWSGGRQWFEILIIFSVEKLANDVLATILNREFPDYEDEDDEEY